MSMSSRREAWPRPRRNAPRVEETGQIWGNEITLVAARRCCGPAAALRCFEQSICPISVYLLRLKSWTVESFPRSLRLHRGPPVHPKAAN